MSENDKREQQQQQRQQQWQQQRRQQQQRRANLGFRNLAFSIIIPGNGKSFSRARVNFLILIISHRLRMRRRWPWPWSWHKDDGNNIRVMLRWWAVTAYESIVTRITWTCGLGSCGTVRTGDARKLEMLFVHSCGRPNQKGRIKNESKRGSNAIGLSNL